MCLSSLQPLPFRVHVVSIVTFADDSKYHVDVGFGGDGATMPLPLEDGLIHLNLGTQEIRLVRDWIPTQTKRTECSKLWVFQYRNGAGRGWNSFYAFSHELEFMQADFEVMNWWTGHNPRFYQTKNAILIKFLRRAAGGEQSGGVQEIYGKRMLVNGVIKENLGGKTRVVEECKSEEERVEGLEKYFGITLTDEERMGIRGWATELRST